MRRPIVAVIGNAEASPLQLALAEEIGRRLVDAGMRVLTGGLGGVMEAASRGARQAARYQEGDVVGIVPGADPATANPHVDIVIASGMGLARNALVVQAAQAVVAIGGGAGTLSEIALGWQCDKPIIALDIEGFSGELAGRALDGRRRPAVLSALDAEQAVAAVVRELGWA